MLGDPDAAEDVFAATFMALLRRRERWERRGTARAFLFTIARNLCLDQLRHHQRRRRLGSELLESQRSLCYSPSPEAVAILREDAARLEEALASLPAAHREVVLLRLVSGMSGEETAQVLGITEEQVRSQLSYARKLLRSMLVEQPAPMGVPAWGRA